MSLQRSALLALASVLILPGCVTVAPNVEGGTRLTAFGTADEPNQPPGIASNETTPEQLQLAREQGTATGAAFRYLADRVPGAEAGAGEYVVGYLMSAPEGYYQSTGGRSVWTEPSGTAHLAVVVRDGYDGRIVPQAMVRVRAQDASGREVLSQDLPFGWHPVLNRYADDVTLAPGTYTLRVEIDPPRIRRHDPSNGDRYHEPTVAVFENVEVPAELPAEPTDEAAIRMARAQGDALARALRAMINGEAVDGSETTAGDVRVAYAVEYAESFWDFRGDKLAFDFSAEMTSADNSHVEIAPRDALTGRFLPGLAVTTTFSRGGREVAQLEPGLMWHPWLYHYGMNLRVPRAGAYQLRVQIEPPPYRLWTRRGDFFATPLDVTFDDVDVKTGQK